MKNFLLLGLFFPSIVFSARAPFSGIYGGINVGVIQNEVENEQLAEIFMPGVVNYGLYPDVLKLTDLSVAGGIVLGAANVLKNSFFCGVEAHFNFQDLNAKFNDTLEEQNAFLVIQSDRFLKLNNDLALLAKFGYVFDQKYLVFAVMGVDWAHFEVSTNFYYTEENIGSTQTGRIQNKETAYKAGAVLGIGTEYLIAKNSTIGMEYNYIFHNALDFSKLVVGNLLTNGVIQNDSLISNRNGIQSKMNRFTIKYNYYFA